MATAQDQPPFAIHNATTPDPITHPSPPDRHPHPTPHLPHTPGPHLQHLPDLGLKPHVQHPVGLIQHHVPDAVEAGVALLQVVDEAAGGGHHDLHAHAQLVPLLVHLDAPHDDAGAHAAAAGLPECGDLVW